MLRNVSQLVRGRGVSNTRSVDYQESLQELAEHGIDDVAVHFYMDGPQPLYSVNGEEAAAAIEDFFAGFDQLVDGYMQEYHGLFDKAVYLDYELWIPSWEWQDRPDKYAEVVFTMDSEEELLREDYTGQVKA